MKTTVIEGDEVELHFETPYVILYWDARNGWVGSRWKRIALGDNWQGFELMQELLDRGLDLMQAKGSSRWLGDTRESPVITPETQRWTNAVWWPRALDSGFRWLALIVPRSTLAQMAIEQSTRWSQQDGRSELRYFETREAAKEWLASKV